MSCPGYVERRSLTFADGVLPPIVVHAPGPPPSAVGAVRKTPWYGRGENMSEPRHGAVSASYTTYMRSPRGEIAGAAYSGRSPGSDAVTGPFQVFPPSFDHDRSVRLSFTFE